MIVAKSCYNTCCQIRKQLRSRSLGERHYALRHTAATWLMQRGVPIWQAVGHLGISAEVMECRCGHHRPDCMRAAEITGVLSEGALK